MNTVLLTAALLGLVTLAQAQTVRLAWDPPATGVPEGYVLYRQEGESGPFEELATIPAPTTAYTDETAPVGVVCYYCTAYVAEEESVPSNTVCFPDLEERPSAPARLRWAP